MIFISILRLPARTFNIKSRGLEMLIGSFLSITWSIWGFHFDSAMIPAASRLYDPTDSRLLVILLLLFSFSLQVPSLLAQQEPTKQQPLPQQQQQQAEHQCDCKSTLSFFLCFSPFEPIWRDLISDWFTSPHKTTPNDAFVSCSLWRRDEPWNRVQRFYNGRMGTWPFLYGGKLCSIESTR